MARVRRKDDVNAVLASLANYGPVIDSTTALCRIALSPGKGGRGDHVTEFVSDYDNDFPKWTVKRTVM
jgi:hypothetical protein